MKSNKQIFELYNEQQKAVSAISVVLSKRFVMNLNTLERFYSLFSEIEGLEKGLTIKLIEENNFLIVSFLEGLKLPCSTQFILSLYQAYVLSINLLVDLTAKLITATNSSIGWEPVPDGQKSILARKAKYKVEDIGKSKNINIFYEFIPPFYLSNYQILCTFDSIRKTLLDHGDLKELIEGRDFVLSLYKYFEYKTLGVSSEQH